VAGYTALLLIKRYFRESISRDRADTFKITERTRSATIAELYLKGQTRIGDFLEVNQAYREISVKQFEKRINYDYESM